MLSADKLGRLVARSRKWQHSNIAPHSTAAAVPSSHVHHPGGDTSSATVTKYSAGDAASAEPSSNSNPHFVLTSETELVDNLLRRTETLINSSSSNVIAFSGGVDSSLAAALVHRVFTKQIRDIPATSSSSLTGSVTAVLGLSPAVPSEQIDTARSVAAEIGVTLQEVRTEEGSDPTYVANEGEACLACKSHLYSTLNAVAAAASNIGGGGGQHPPPSHPQHEQGEGEDDRPAVILYNGTNADDTQDPTRLGLVAASEFRVASPLLYTTKADVRRAAKHLGLPNWNHAAAPCLRSRLAFGVEATRRHLEAVGEAERRVRGALRLDQSVNMRVRYLAGRRAMVELDEDVMRDRDAEAVLQRQGFDAILLELGFESYGVRAFKSGSVAALVRSKRVKGRIS